MYRALILLAAFGLASPAFAKVKMQKAHFAKKGKFHLSGGLIEFVSTTTKVMKPTEGDGVDSGHFNLNPSVGYFVIPNLELGLTINYQSASQEKLEASEFAAGPHVAYYYKATPFVFAYGRGSFSYVMSKGVQNDGNDAFDEMGGYTLGLEAGVAIAFGQKVGGTLSFGAGYLMETETDKVKGATDETERDLSSIGLMTRYGVYF